ncbi:sensor histidine kinase [Marinimicrobium agarilyticum]|uniref:sensor histidine kinase n=1 Tax=Marinimicrobium agarilyticum TaxID=306546 RepID=UPI0004143C63|nr:HAMP domain-containing sensor histidine kinase [Marinimicrobium agarilyticum]
MSQPKGLSLSQQWLLIAVVTMVPVLVVVAYASWSLYQQLQLQRELVSRSDSLRVQHSQLNEEARDLERFARQYRLLRDDTFLEPYMEKYQSLLLDVGELRDFLRRERNAQGGPVAEAQHNELAATLTGLSASLAGLEPAVLESSDEQGFADALQELSQARAHLGSAVSAYGDALRTRGEKALQDILQRLFLMGVISLPLTLTLMALGFLQMIRPIRRLSWAIRNLGHGDWNTPIAVTGPRDFQALGERLEWMRDQLRDADQQKQAFLRHVSHELKTPLSAIVEAGSLLKDEVPGPINTKQESVVRILLENSRNLQELIQQLLNYNTTTHSVGLRRQSVSVSELCARLTARLDQQNWRHRVIWECAGRPDTLKADPQLLEMILTNLLSNAYHYSPHDGRVSVSWGMEDSEAWICVEDEGPGIDAADQEKIFQPFVQGHVRRHGSVHGSGVGLAIVKESVARLGGEVKVESRPDKGSRFLLRFPMSPSSDKENVA